MKAKKYEMVRLAKYSLYATLGLTLFLLPQDVLAHTEEENSNSVPMADISDHRIEKAFAEDIKETSEENTIEESDNLVENGDFDQVAEGGRGAWTGSQPENWNIWNPVKAENYRAEVDDQGHLVLESKEEEFRVAVTQDIENIDDSKSYELSYDIKTENMTNTARVRIQSLDQEKEYTNQEYASGTSYGTTDWQTFTYDYKPIEHTTMARIELFFETGTGTTYFDNIRFIEQNNTQNQNNIFLDNNATITLHKKYIPNTRYTYVSKNPNIIKNANGFLNPLQLGQGEIEIRNDEGEWIHSFQLSVIEEAEKEEKTKHLLNTWNEMTTGNQFYNSRNEKMLRKHIRLEESVSRSIEEYIWSNNKEFLWEDLPDFTSSSNLTDNYRRLETIAKQITNPNSTFYEDIKALQTVKDGLLWLNLNYYNEDQSIKGNWWDYEIGVPRAINNTLALLYDYFSFEEIQKLTEPIQKFVPKSDQFRVTTGNPFKPVGGNLVDMGRVKIIAGILRQDASTVKEIIDFVLSGIKYVEEEGFYRDGSYIDHTNVALNGAYGSVFVDGLSQLLPVMNEFEEIPEEKFTILYEWIDRNFLSLLNKGETMDFVRGRAISRPELQSHEAGAEILRGIARIGEISTPEKEVDILSKVKYHIISNREFFDIYNALNSYRDIHLFEKIGEDSQYDGYNRPQSLYTFNDMDKLSYHNPKSSFALGISMHSDKTQNYETMNGENLKGWYTGDGMVYLYNGDNDHYNAGYWATVNPYLLPGTTILLEERIIGDGEPDKPNQTTLNSSFVGSNKLSEAFGTIAMDFNNYNDTLRAKKFWHISDDEIVFLGSDMATSNPEAKMITTIANRKSPKNDSYATIINGEKITENGVYNNVQSILLESTHPNTNIGYIFLKPGKIKINKVTRTGDWKDINRLRPSQIESNEFTEISIIDQDDQYAYIVIPNISKDNFEMMIENIHIQLLENSSSIQAIFDEKDKVWGIVKYDDSAYLIDNRLAIKNKGIYTIYKSEMGEYILSYLNPVGDTDHALAFDHFNAEVLKSSSADDLSIIYSLSAVKTSDSQLEISKKDEEATFNSSATGEILKAKTGKTLSVERGGVVVSRKDTGKTRQPMPIIAQSSKKVSEIQVQSGLPQTGSVRSLLITPILILFSGLGLMRKKKE